MRPKIRSLAQICRIPTHCALCKQYHYENLAICLACVNLLPRLGPACRHCARPIPYIHNAICGPCSIKKPYVDNVITAFRFEEPIRSLIHNFKYKDAIYLGPFLATLILSATSLDAQKTQCLIPIPMHKQKLQTRGFNQSVILAKFISQRLQIPCLLNICQKIINTVAQTNLNAAERQHNLTKAFQVKPSQYNHVTLIDDLYTTGSTANSLALALKQQGVSQVDLWCCARTIQNQVI